MNKQLSNAFTAIGFDGDNDIDVSFDMLSDQKSIVMRVDNRAYLIDSIDIKRLVEVINIIQCNPHSP